MNEHMIRWIWASFTKHFESLKQKYPMYIEGHDRLGNSTDHFEFRMDGPFFGKPNKLTEVYDVHINILVTSLKDDKDAHKIHRVVGIAASMFTDSISVYRFGNESGVDNQTIVGCFMLQDARPNEKLIVTNFGIVSATNNVMQSTVEGSYQLRRTL